MLTSRLKIGELSGVMPLHHERVQVLQVCQELGMHFPNPDSAVFRVWPYRVSK